MNPDSQLNALLQKIELDVIKWSDDYIEYTIFYNNKLVYTYNKQDRRPITYVKYLQKDMQIEKEIYRGEWIFMRYIDAQGIPGAANNEKSFFEQNNDNLENKN